MNTISEPVVIVDSADGVGTITLNRPAKSNAMNMEMLEGIEAGLRQHNADPDVKVVLFRGVGKGFSGGYDIGPANAERVLNSNPIDDWSRLRTNAERWLYVMRFRKPTIAQLHGYCLAGAFELASACDFVIAADDTRIGHPAVRQVGTPAFLALPILLPPLTVKRLLLTGDIVSGAEAEKMGFVAEAVPLEKLEDQVARLCQRLCLMPLDQLIMLKASLTRAYEIKDNLSALALSSVEYDAIAHRGPAVMEFWSGVGERGLKATIADRDTPFDEDAKR